MNYRLKDRSTEKRSYRIHVFIGVAVIALLVAFRIFAPYASSSLAQKLGLPFWKTGNTIQNQAGLGEGFVKSKSTLIAENQALQSELEKAHLQLAAQENLQAENQELRIMLGIAEKTKFEFVSVLSKPPVSPYDTLVIEGGRDKGVQVGNLVFAGENFILGEISEVYEKTSLVKLYSTPGEESTAMIERTNVTHTVLGDGAGNFEMKVPKELDIHEGDVLLIPGTHKKILGEVRSVESEATASYQNVLVRTPVNIFQLKWVGIEKLK